MRARLLLLGTPLPVFAFFLGLRLTSGTEGLPQAIRLVLAAIAASVFLVLAAAEALAPRFGRSGPGRAILFAWLALFAACAHDLSPPVAFTRLVPALFFASCAVFLEGWELAVALPAAAAFASTGFGTANLPLEAASAAGLALGSVLLSRRIRRPGGGGGESERDGRPPAREAVARMVNPWQGEASPEAEGSTTAPEAGDDRVLRLVAGGVFEVLDALRTALGADTVFYAVPDRDPAKLYTVPFHSLGPELPELPGLPPDFPPLREALLFGQSHRAEGGEAGRWTVTAPGGGRLPLGRVAVLPVKGGGEGHVIGALCALCFGPGGWDDGAMYLMAGSVQLLGYQREVGMEVNRMVRERRRHDSLRLLVEGIARAAERGGEEGSAGEGRGAAASRMADGSGHRHEVYRLVTRHLHEMVGARRVLLVEVEKGSDGGRGRVAAAWPEAGALPGQGAGGTADLREGNYLAKVFAQGKARVVVPREGRGGAGKEERRGAGIPVIPREWGFDPSEGWILVPVRDGELFEGVLACSLGHGPTRREEQAAADALALLRMGLSHAVQVEALHSRATQDGLTGLMNRRTYLEHVEHELERVDRRHPCSLAMLDVDHFKRVNDVYGHPAGDEVLRRVASVIRKTIRKADYAGRYGGEEFSIYFSGLDKAAALQAAERLRVLVREVKFDFGGKEFSVTVSLGLAAYPDHGTTAEELVRRADEALYRSKREGRDRTTVADGR